MDTIELPDDDGVEGGAATPPGRQPAIDPRALVLVLPLLLAFGLGFLAAASHDPPLRVAVTCAEIANDHTARVCGATAPGASVHLVVVYCEGSQPVADTAQPVQTSDSNGAVIWNWTPHVAGCMTPVGVYLASTWHGQTADIALQVSTSSVTSSVRRPDVERVIAKFRHDR
jgi:hypothetical protein